MTANVDVRKVDFILQIDFKYNKFRYRITDIKSTVKGREDAIFFRKYLVDVAAEVDKKIINGEVKGYSKRQKKRC